MRRILLLVLCASLVGVLVVGSPNVKDFITAKTTIEQSLGSLVQSREAVSENKAKLDKAKDNFDSSRTFDLDYSDLENVTKLLNAVSGIKVKSTSAVTVAGNFTDDQEWVSDKPVEAVKIVLTCANAFDALRVLQKVQLPVQSLTWADGQVTVIVLSGKEVSVNG